MRIGGGLGRLWRIMWQIMFKGLMRLGRVPRSLVNRLVDGVLAGWLLRGLGVRLGVGVELVGVPVVQMVREGVIGLADGVRLVSRPGRNPLYIYRPCVLRLLRPGAKIMIGANSALSGTVICAEESVTIGAHVLVGANVTIVDTDFHPLDAAMRRVDRNVGAKCRPIVIGDDVFIGTQAIILKGTELGRGCVVGAGAVVSGVFPAGVIIAGNPAQIIASPRVKTDG